MISTALSSSVEANLIGGILVAVFVAIATIGISMLNGQRRTHEALFGYREGNTEVKGIVDIVRGNGHGSLLEVCEAAMDQAIANGNVLAEHIATDDARMDGINDVLASLTAGQAAAAETAAEAKADLAPVVPIKKAVPVKKALPRKRTARKPAPT